jgi:hypothetical protein
MQGTEIKAEQINKNCQVSPSLTPKTSSSTAENEFILSFSQELLRILENEKIFEETKKTPALSFKNDGETLLNRPSLTTRNENELTADSQIQRQNPKNITPIALKKEALKEKLIELIPQFNLAGFAPFTPAINIKADFSSRLSYYLDQLIDQIAQHLQIMKSKNETMVKFDLISDSLGKINVTLNSIDGKISVFLLVPSDQLSFWQEKSIFLENRLACCGVNLSSVDINSQKQKDFSHQENNGDLATDQNAISTQNVVSDLNRTVFLNKISWFFQFNVDLIA